jgi:hypothetical protein
MPIRAERYQPRRRGMYGHGSNGFFFDSGNGGSAAFFWFADAPDRVPGLSSPAAIGGVRDVTRAVSTMTHLAFHVPAEKFDAYRQRLNNKGMRVGPVLNHDGSDVRSGDGASRRLGAFILSSRPRGITLEFAWRMQDFAVTHTPAVPKTAADRRWRSVRGSPPTWHRSCTHHEVR